MLSRKLFFSYSRPYEHALLRLSRREPGKEHDEKGVVNVKLARKAWAPHEKEVLSLFSEIYKIDIEENSIEVFISLALKHSYSHPMTIAVRKYKLQEGDKDKNAAFVFTLIHELAHYFAYTRPKDTQFNRLFKKVLEKNLLGTKNANLHFLINAVEYGIGAEVLSETRAKKKRKFVLENFPEDYVKATSLLIKKGVPLNKNCLEYIEQEVLSE